MKMKIENKMKIKKNEENRNKRNKKFMNDNKKAPCTRSRTNW